jgi:drug/metabolite transporter (DMT)-like permease
VRVTLNYILFAVMSLVWGITWLATKVALAAVPPVFFGAVRFALVSALLVVVVRGVGRLLAGPLAWRIGWSGMLINVGCYGFLYWGMQYVASGVAAVVNMSMNPVFLFGFAILYGQERANWRHALALALGIAGLVILFSGKASFSGTDIELWAAAAIIASSVCYSLGSVLSRPLLDAATPLQLTAAQSVVAFLGMGALTLALEPVSGATFEAMMHPAPLAGLLFMVFIGTLVGFTIFLRLVRAWGAPRAGLYSFVSPVVALILGTLVLGEPLTWREVTGGAIMLVAAAIAVAPRREASHG